MRLQRYNEVLFALVGTGVLLGLILLAATVLTNMPWKGDERGISVAKHEPKKQPQRLVFCSPSFVEGSPFQYFPVAAVSAEDASKAPVLAMSSGSYDRGNYFNGCGLKYPSDDSRIFNVVVRDTTGGKQSLLLERPGQIASLLLPDAKCAEGIGTAPCNTLVWTIRNEDTNGDGLINGEDALVAYLSDLSASSLRPVTPSNATVLATSWDARSNEILFQVRRDTNGDGKFSAEDGAELLAISPSGSDPARVIVDAALLEKLQDAVR